MFVSEQTTVMAMVGTNLCYHLCFKQAQPKMGHSPKVDDKVDIFLKNFLNTYFLDNFFVEEL